MITYAIGDVHGRFDLLLRALDLIEHDCRGETSHLVMLGDYVDRGPQSRQVVELLKSYDKNDVTCLQGNHEQLMMESCRRGLMTGTWMKQGGVQTLASYQGSKVLNDHLTWMEDLPTYVERQGRLFVHAGFEPGVALAHQDEDVMKWIRDKFLIAREQFRGWPHIVHGHTPVHNLKTAGESPELLTWRTNLDTGAFYTGVMMIGVFEGDGGPPSRVLRVML